MSFSKYDIIHKKISIKVAKTQPKKFWYICDFSQWHKSSDDVINWLKTKSPNHIQTCSQLLKAHVAFVEWIFWHLIKVNTTLIKVLNITFKAMHPTKIPWLGPCNFVWKNFVIHIQPYTYRHQWVSWSKSSR